MQHLLRYLRLSLSYVRQHCCANMDNSAVLQFRCGDKREHVLVGHSMALSNAARASLCLSLHVLCVCHCMFSLCLSLHVLTICKSLRNYGQDLRTELFSAEIFHLTPMPGAATENPPYVLHMRRASAPRPCIS